MPLPPRTPEDKRQLLEVHAALFLRAPDNFLKFEGVADENQQSLESTVAMLHRGVDHVFRWPWQGSRRRRLHQVIDATYAEFAAGRIHEGRMMCHELEDLIEGAVGVWLRETSWRWRS
jgi:hypothetical protein